MCVGRMHRLPTSPYEICHVVEARMEQVPNQPRPLPLAPGDVCLMSDVSSRSPCPINTGSWIFFTRRGIVSEVRCVLGIS